MDFPKANSDNDGQENLARTKHELRTAEQDSSGACTEGGVHSNGDNIILRDMSNFFAFNVAYCRILSSEQYCVFRNIMI